jgi:hypothetical protein
MDWLFFRKTRHLVHEIPRGSLKIVLYRCHVGHETYEYELDLRERKKHDSWKTLGTVRLHEVEAVGFLFKEVVAYVNGLR